MPEIDYDEFQLSTDDGVTWTAATKDEYMAAEGAAGFRGSSDKPATLSFSNGDQAGRRYPLTKPSVEVRYFAEIATDPTEAVA